MCVCVCVCVWCVCVRGVCVRGVYVGVCVCVCVSRWGWMLTMYPTMIKTTIIRIHSICVFMVSISPYTCVMKYFFHLDHAMRVV